MAGALGEGRENGREERGVVVAAESKGHPHSRAGAPRVVALGGGRGLAVTLRALRSFAGEITAVVSVADDGGSSGRLRAGHDQPAPGDLRKCLVALAGASSPWPDAFAYRFSEGDLAGHALGNLVLAGLVAVTGDLVQATTLAGELLEAVGRVVPATTGPVSLVGWREGRTEAIRGQAALSATVGVRRVALEPEGAVATPAAIAALRQADQIVLGPGSLFTSVLAAAIVPEMRDVLCQATATRVYVAGLAVDAGEMAGLSLAEEAGLLGAHGVVVDVVLFDAQARGAEPPRPAGARIWPAWQSAELQGESAGVHDEARLARALRDLVGWRTTA